MALKKGTLYLIPSSLGSEQPADYLPPIVLRLADVLDEWIVEDEKTARRFLRAIGMKRPFDGIRLQVLNEHTSPDAATAMLSPALHGKDIGLMSDAGCPGIADPGSDVVRVAHERGIRVVPIPGPSSILLTIMASGLNGQQFIFHGYLPRERGERIAKIKRMEMDAHRMRITQVFMDTPYRSGHVLEDLIHECRPDTLLCLAASITCANESIKTKKISEWKLQPPELGKAPVMFALG